MIYPSELRWFRVQFWRIETIWDPYYIIYVCIQLIKKKKKKKETKNVDVIKFHMYPKIMK